MDYKDIANRLRKWANGETCEDCPAKDDLAFCAADTIRELLSKVKELEDKNKRLEEARENANEACAKWEGLYRAELEKKSAWVSVKDRLPELINGKYAESVLVTDGEFRHIAYHYGKWFFCDSGQMKEPMFYKVTHWMPLPEPPKEE